MAYDRQFKHKKQWNNFDGGRKKSFKRRDDFPKPDGLQVFVKNNDVQKALRKLKPMVKDTNLMEDLKNIQYFRKPSEIPLFATSFSIIFVISTKFFLFVSIFKFSRICFNV